MATEFVLTSPDGVEHRTSSPVLRSRLLAQGYAEGDYRPSAPAVTSSDSDRRARRTGGFSTPPAASAETE